MTKRKPWLNGKPLLLSTIQVGTLLGVRTDTVRRWIYNGDLKAVHLNERNKITPKALYDFLVARGLDDIAAQVYTPPPPPPRTPTVEEIWTPEKYWSPEQAQEPADQNPMEETPGGDIPIQEDLTLPLTHEELIAREREKYLTTPQPPAPPVVQTHPTPVQEPVKAPPPAPKTTVISQPSKEGLKLVKVS